MVCQACEKRGKTWQGSDPKCAFDAGEFTPDNWNCATLNELREHLFYGQSTVDYRCHDDDQHVATVALDWDSECESESKLVRSARSLWVSWYKSRGRTESIWLLGECGLPFRPTEDEVLAVIKQLRETV